jgi:hypothetical protein
VQKTRSETEHGRYFLRFENAFANFLQLRFVFRKHRNVGEQSKIIAGPDAIQVLSDDSAKRRVSAIHNRAGIRRIIIPARNEADLEEIPEDVRGELNIKAVTRIKEVVDAALENVVANPPPPVPPELTRRRPPEPDASGEPLIARER